MDKTIIQLDPNRASLRERMKLLEQKLAKVEKTYLQVRERLDLVIGILNAAGFKSPEPSPKDAG